MRNVSVAGREPTPAVLQITLLTVFEAHQSHQNTQCVLDDLKRVWLVCAAGAYRKLESFSIRVMLAPTPADEDAETVNQI